MNFAEMQAKKMVDAQAQFDAQQQTSSEVNTTVTTEVGPS